MMTERPRPGGEEPTFRTPPLHVGATDSELADRHGFWGGRWAKAVKTRDSWAARALRPMPPPTGRPLGAESSAPPSAYSARVSVLGDDRSTPGRSTPPQNP